MKNVIINALSIIAGASVVFGLLWVIGLASNFNGW